MNSTQSSYRQIVKSTSIFGGVQLINIIIQIARSKAVAVLLGPSGMGVNTLLNTTITFIGVITNFGLKTSAVKNVAQANSEGDSKQVAKVVTVLRRMVWLTGILGTITMLVLSPILSELNFGNKEYTLAFVWIAITLLFRQISSGQTVLIQGLRKLKYLANATVSGSIIGLIFSVPFYYFWGFDGIVPAIIVTSIANLIRTWYFSSKVRIRNIKVSKKETYNIGKEMLFMGAMLSLGAIITKGSSFLIRIFISNIGGVDQVGLYGAGFNLISTYVGLVFTAISADYYPRLSSVATNKYKTVLLINQQSEITMLILGPILTIFVVFINWVVIILYSNEFTLINSMIQWAALGMLFKAISWPLGFLFIVKGNSKLYLTKELLINAVLLSLIILGYYLGGLSGVGIAFVIGNITNFIIVHFLAKMQYGFLIADNIKRILFIELSFVVLCFLTVKLVEDPYSFFIGSAIIIAALVYSLSEINRRVNLLDIIHRFWKKS